jgi:hypothetical protein
MKNKLREELEAMLELHTGDSFTADNVHTLVNGIFAADEGGGFVYVGYDNNAFPYPQTIGSTANSIVGLGNADENMIDTIFIMPNKSTNPDATLMIVVDEVTPETNPKTYQYIYVGNINNLPSDVLTESSIVDIPGTGLKSVMSQKGATDLVSEYNVSTNNNNTEYTFSQAVALVPVSLQKGGLTIKYIDSTMHKYVVKRLTSSTWNTTESNWQGIDNEPIAGSNNLVKSGGISDNIESIKAILGAAIKKEVTDNDWQSGYYVTSGGGKQTETGVLTFSIAYIPVESGDIVYMWGHGSSNIAAISYTSNTSNLYYPVLKVGTGSMPTKQSWSAEMPKSSVDSLYAVLCKYNAYPCHAFVLDSSVLKRLITAENNISDILQNIGILENAVNDLEDIVDNQCLKESDFESKSVVYSNSSKASVIEKVGIANTIIKSIELIDVQDYQPGQISILQAYYYQKTSSVNRWINRIRLTQNGTQVWQYDFSIDMWSKPAEDAVIVSQKSHIKVTWNARALFDAGTGSSGFLLNNEDDTSITPSPYLLRDIAETAQKNYVLNSWLGEHCVSENKLTQELIDKINESSTPSILKGKHLVTICDSLGAAGIWQTKLAEFTGMVFDITANNTKYSIGGTKTLNAGYSCGQGRALQLIDDVDNNLIDTPDIIIIENVNDGGGNPGTLTDESFVLSEIITLPDSYKQESDAAAVEYWNTNMATILGGITPKSGTIVKLPYSTDIGIKLTITHAATSSGQFNIYLTDSELKTIDIAAGDSIETIVDKIMTYNFINYHLEKVGSDSVVFTKGYPPMGTISIGDTGTGITYTTTSGIEGTMYVNRYYKGHNIANWLVADNWVSSIPLYQAWKGIVEMLTAAFPNAVIYWFIPKTYQFNYNDPQYTRADGSKDWDAMLVSANQYQTYLFSNQTKMAEYMNIPILDIRKEACINPGNISTFCNNNNVHPKDAGYNRWGEVLARMLM